MSRTHAVMSYASLAGILLLLLLLTAVTIGASRIDLGILNIWIALFIASLKSSLVLLFFMHLRQESRLLKLAFLGTLLCIATLIGFVFWDTAFR